MIVAAAAAVLCPCLYVAQHGSFVLLQAKAILDCRSLPWLRACSFGHQRSCVSSCHLCLPKRFATFLQPDSLNLSPGQDSLESRSTGRGSLRSCAADCAIVGHLGSFWGPNTLARRCRGRDCAQSRSQLTRAGGWPSVLPPKPLPRLIGFHFPWQAACFPKTVLRHPKCPPCLGRRFRLLGRLSGRGRCWH